MTTLTSSEVRRRIRVVGVVQGVGFRPFVYRLATGLGLSGCVGNDSDGVFIEVEGDESALDLFSASLTSEAPPLARIFGIGSSSLDLRHDAGFRIVESDTLGTPRTFVAPDIAVCGDCVAEMLDPADRRWRYPFINCTNCGPRFTITRRLPYDRRHTTMEHFALCDACATEYHEPGDRRFHAQPVACATCGPHLWFEGPHGVFMGTDQAIAATQHALGDGEIVAIKGLGGYHLACDASSSAALVALRARKQRVGKPLAVMVADMEVAHSLAWISPQEEELLLSPERPIVLLARRQGTALAEEVAPGNPTVGLLLPYTPLHHLLFQQVPGHGARRPRILVMTSGNLTDEPICYEDADARTRLGGIADAWLLHDRPIHVPCDDSVVRMSDGDVLPIRRSRGYAPLPVRLPFEVAPVLAMGGELKNTFCLASGREAWVSQHIGDMGSVETLCAFQRSTSQFGDIYAVTPECVAADAHPGYQTRRWAEEQVACDVALVQHHHAHLAAVMVEHGVPEDDRVIGFAFDGTGYGTDGAIWGGEVLIAGYDGFERPLHLRYVPLPGGDVAVRKPYRAALSHLWAAGIEWSPDLPPVQRATKSERDAIRSQLERSVGCISTSSMGRLFDAVSSLIGVRHEASYEAQAAMDLEWAASEHMDAARPYRFATDRGEIDPAPVLRALIDDLRSGCAIGPMAAGFHLAVADLIAQIALGLRETTGINRVALSGGVFQNVLVLRLAGAKLVERGLEVLTHRLVPPNDGGLALGQAAVAGRAAAGRSRAW
jgi:hydrogenase maturation protein HypF